MGLAEHNPVFVTSAGLALAALLASTGRLAIAFARHQPVDAKSGKLRDIVLLAGTANLVSLGLAAIVWFGVAFLPFAFIPYVASLALVLNLEGLASDTAYQARTGIKDSIWLGALSGGFLIALPALEGWPILGQIVLIVTLLLCTFQNWGALDQHIQSRRQQDAGRGLFRHAVATQFRPGSALGMFLALFLSSQARRTGLAGQEMFVAIVASVLAASAWQGIAQILQPRESDYGEFLSRLGVSLGCLGAIFIGLPTSVDSLSTWMMAGVAGALLGLLLVVLMILSAMHWFWAGRSGSRQYHLISFLALMAAILAFILWLPVTQGVSEFERLAAASVLCLVFASLPKNWVDWGGQRISGLSLGKQDDERIET
jgi:hypothetical protein